MTSWTLFKGGKRVASPILRGTPVEREEVKDMVLREFLIEIGFSLLGEDMFINRIDEKLRVEYHKRFELWMVTYDGEGTSLSISLDWDMHELVEYVMDEIRSRYSRGIE
jgi:hypothetical protein